MNNMDWQPESLCAPIANTYVRDNDYFFSGNPDDTIIAKRICSQCPVRAECLQYALEHRKLDGVWGGRDEREIRRTLSVDFKGEEVRRRRFPFCPHCGAHASKLDTGTADLPNGGRWTTARIVYCTECKFSWRSRTSVNAVNAYRTYAAQQKRLTSSD
jgi:WhiB family redox-sensing transcriptional regulator